MPIILNARELLEKAVERHLAGSYEDAFNTYKGVLEMEPENPGALCGIAMIVHRNKDLETAEALFRRSIFFHPEHIEAYSGLAGVYSSAGRIEQAVAVCNAGIMVDPSFRKLHESLYLLQTGFNRRKNDLYIYHHLGLGDHLICCAIVRYYAQLYDNVLLFVKPHNIESVTFMFRDLQNVNYIMGDDGQVNSFIRNNPGLNILKIGHEWLERVRCTFDEAFYRFIGMAFSQRWKGFFFQREPEKEKELARTLNPDNQPFIFIHDDPERNLVIREDMIPKDVRIIRNDRSFLIFHYAGLLENALEIHCIDSSFKHMIDGLDITRPRLFYHLYPRGTGNEYRTACRLDWTIIE